MPCSEGCVAGQPGFLLAFMWEWSKLVAHLKFNIPDVQHPRCSTVQCAYIAVCTHLCHVCMYVHAYPLDLLSLLSGLLNDYKVSLPPCCIFLLMVKLCLCTLPSSEWVSEMSSETQSADLSCYNNLEK